MRKLLLAAAAIAMFFAAAPAHAQGIMRLCTPHYTTGGALSCINVGEQSPTVATPNPLPVGGVANAAAPTFTEAAAGYLSFDLSGNLRTILAPSAGAAAGITPVVSGSAESSHVFKATGGNLYGAYISNPSASGFLLIFNSATVPGDGAVTPIHCIPVSASNVAFVNFLPGPPEVYSTGIAAALSSTGCFTKTTSPTGFFHGYVQ